MKLYTAQDVRKMLEKQRFVNWYENYFVPVVVEGAHEHNDAQVEQELERLLGPGVKQPG
mgnify:CR=1 FL=1